MALLLSYFGILACLMSILDYVDSKGNQHHSPNDREHHNRPHNLHRAGYEGYDWSKHGYERNFDPIMRLPKDKKRGKAMPRSIQISPYHKLNPMDLEKILKGRLSPEEKDEIIEVLRLKKKIDIKIQETVDKTYFHMDQVVKLRGFDVVATLIQAFLHKGNAYILPEMKLLKPEIIQFIPEIEYLFHDEFQRKPQVEEAFQLLIEELEKRTDRNVDHSWFSSQFH